MALTKVTTSGITDDAVNAAKIADGTLAAADIANGAVTSAKLAGSIANAKLANNSITVNGSAVSLGGSTTAGSIDWQSKVTSDGSTVTTMVAGRGYFVDNSSAAGIVKLPASASAGDTVAIKDYAGNFGTNNLTIQRNSHNIQGEANNSTISTNRASLVLVYIDATKGWLYTNESNVGDLGPPFVDATGGTVTTSGDDRIHTFTGDGNFVVSNAGKPGGSNTVNYLVVAGGASGGNFGGGGGAGGLRTNYPSPGTGGLSVSAQTYPITVGAGGAATPTGCGYVRGNDGSNTIFSTITSEGGGGGGTYWPGPPTSGNNVGRDGGSGGGGGVVEQPRAQTVVPGSAGSGNTPPVSPSQGNPGGNGSRRTGTGTNDYGGGGGGGGHNSGGSPGTANDGPSPAGPASGGAGGGGGAGSPNQVNGSNVTYAGGGGGTMGASGGAGGGGAGATNSSSAGNAGTANTGGGGGASRAGSQASGAGGSGVVIIRYKIQ